ncbi:Hypothetical predicted protein [Lynx pardinus]|uniref:Uncharacterized protein n=1 Tax=Lynx pardinus TaxID=191816 RepID=A0A485PR75_LYNPA|nr:Hypothetical predicted protein [Lynx pardinus]
MLVPEFLRMYSAIAREHLRELRLQLSFYGDPEKVEKEEQTTAEKTVTKEEF